MRKKLICIGIALLFLALSWGCSNDSKDMADNTEEYIIGVAAKSSSTEYWMSVRSGMEAAAERVGAKVMFFAPDAEENTEAQEKLILALIRRNVDVLAISAIDAFTEPEYLEEARKRGITVVTFDSGFADSDIPYIGIDNEQVGYEMGKYLAEKLGYEGNIGIVSGELDQMCHKERVEGAEKYIETVPGMTISYIESGYSGAKMSGEKLAKLREEYPNVKGLVVTSAVTALGIIESSEAGSMRIVTIDVQEDALNALKNRSISGLAAQSGYDIGYETVRYADSLRKGETEAKDIILDTELLTPDNVEDYIEKRTK